MDVSALRERLGLHARSAHDFLDTLVALGFLQRDDAGRYSNGAEAAQFLDPASDRYVGGLLEMLNTRLFGFWGSLTEALRTGEPQNEAKSGGDLFGSLYADPARLEGFLRAMTGLSLPLADALAKALPWETIHRVVDVGAAQGCMPVRLARAHPHLSAIGFDLPVVEPIFTRYVTEHGLSERVRFVAGDFFTDALPAADALIMSKILHDWDLPQKRMLIGKAHVALPPGGWLVVCEMLIDDARRTHVPGLLMSLNMLIETRGGFDFTGADCIGWMRDAGFSDARVVALPGPHGAVVGIK
jgi:hypothetical protein